MWKPLVNFAVLAVVGTQSWEGTMADVDVRELADGGEVHSEMMNKLGESRSPYVRRHMNNPVAWQMWNREALELAKQTDRLLFVSIGYSACHCRNPSSTSRVAMS